MSQLHCNKRRVKGKHFRYEERQVLERLMIINYKIPKKKKLTQKQIANFLGISLSTLKRELERGKVYLRDTSWLEYRSYSASISQQLADLNATGKGPLDKIGANHALAEKFRYWIVEQHYSPHATIKILSKDADYLKSPISVKTLYNYIEKGYLPEIELKHLRRKGKQRKSGRRTLIKAPRDALSKSITERPVEANDRSEYGHWEMDCIESGKKKSKACLLVMVERQTRESMIFKLRAQTQVEVIGVINRLERRMGKRKFKETFKSITVDNGSEFMNWRGIEQSCISSTGKPRTAVYFCHPYCSWERGTNEQTNGILRLFFPKGSAISEFSKSFVKKVETWLNNYPRKVLNGLSAKQFALQVA